MIPPGPFLLLRARVRPELADEFESWFRDVHLRDALAIPGITAVRGARTAGGTRLCFYAFENAEAVPSALQSPQAAYTRGTWERWQEDLEEFSVEMFSPLGVMPVFHGLS